MSKTLITRIKNKVDSLSVWQNSVVNQVESSTRLLNGEIALVRVPTGASYTNPVTGKTEPVIELLMKVGDGTSTFDQLPWLSAKAADVYDWAKASTVVVDDAGSNLVFKNAGGTAVYSVSLDKFALKGTVSALDSRVTALEGALGVDAGGENSVSKRLETVEGAIETLTGADTVEGSVAKAEKAAKDYAKNLIDNLSYDASGSAAKALEDANAYTDKEVGDIEAVLTAHTSDEENPHKVTKAQVGLGNVENKSTTTIKSEFTGSVATGNNGFVTGGSVYTAIEGAKTAAASDAAAKVKALADGQVKTNTDNIGKNASAIAAEVTRATGVEEDLQEQITANATAIKLLTDGVSADEVDGVNDLINYVKEHGTEVTGIKADIKTNADSIKALSGRMDTAEDDIDGLLADLESANSSIDDVEDRVKAIEDDYLKAEDKYDDTDLQDRVKAIEDDYLTEADKYDDTALKGRMDIAEDDIDAIEAELASHTHSDYENQNAFSNIKVGSTKVAADTATDTVEFVGSNVTITPDATKDKITFTVADGSTTAKGIVQLSDSISSEVSTTAATSKAVKLAYDAGTDAQGRVGNLETKLTDIDSTTTVGATIDSKISTALAGLGHASSGSGGYVTNVTQVDGKVTVTKGDLPTASASAAGITKLYTSLGTSTDGTVTRKVVNDVNTKAADAQTRVEAVENNYIRVDKVDNKDTLVWANGGNVDEIILDCGGAPQA